MKTAPPEWDFARAAPLWTPQTKAVQHVGVPGYQWQTAVLWDGSLAFGPFGFRKIEEFPGARMEKFFEEFGKLGNNRLHLSFAYGDRAKFFDFSGRTSKAIKKRLEDGRLPIPHVETADGDFAWEELVYAHLLGRPMEDGMRPHPDDVLVTHAVFTVRNNGPSPRAARLWMYFGDASAVRFGYKVNVGISPGPPLSHAFEAPFGILDGKVRYMLPAPSAGRFILHDTVRPRQWKVPLTGVVEWQAELAPGASARMEIILPYASVDTETAKRILAVDSEKALAEARAFWRHLITTGALLDTPDEFISDYAAATAGQMAGQVAYRHTGGVWMLKTSPNHYEVYWPVSAARALPAFDLRGLSQYSRPALRSFLDVQSDDMGTLLREFRSGKGDTVAGEGFEKHPGFMGNFPGWTPNVLILNHAMGLWALASHYRITRDDGWLRAGPKSPLDGILLALDWIAVQRRRTMREENGTQVPHWGLLPPSAAHDWLSGSVIFNDAFCIFAAIEAVRMLREIGHPRSEEFAAELAGHRQCLKDRYTEARDRAARLPLPDGTTLPFVPRDVSELDWHSVDWTYASFGPLRAGAWGALDPKDELVDQTLSFLEAGIPEGELNAAANTQVAKDSVDFANWREAFFEGPRRYFWPHYLEYEIMWPIGHDLFLQRDDLPRFFEWFANFFSVVLHKDYRTSAESLNGAPGCSPGDAERWMAIRGMFVNERGGYDGREQSLWLLQAVPRAWLVPGRKTGVSKMGTHFGGLVSVSCEMAPGGKSVSASADIDLAVLPAEIRMRLRSPDGSPLVSAQVNGRDTEVLPADTISLPLQKRAAYRITGAFAT
jgi:hypothetical protein